MNDLSYPSLKQSLLLVFFFFGSFALFFFTAAVLPYIFHWQFSASYHDFIFSIASPICTIPLIIYVSKKSGIPFKWKVKLPHIHLVLLLVLVSICVLIITYPLNNPMDYIENLTKGGIKIAVFEVKEVKLNLVIKFIGAVLITPIFEEIFWRKQILGLLLKKYSPVVSIVLGSLLFACGHGRLHDIGSLFIWGLVFGAVYYQTNSLEASILIHSFSNVFMFVTKHEYVGITEMHLFKYFTTMVVCAIVIYLIIKYIKQFRIVNMSDETVGSNSTEMKY